MLKALRLLKLLRFARLSRLLRRIEDEVSFNASYLRFFRLTAALMLVAHLVACLWFWVGATFQVTRRHRHRAATATKPSTATATSTATISLACHNSRSARANRATTLHVCR